MSFLRKKMTALHARTVICHISYLCNLPMHHVRKVSTHPAKDRITIAFFNMLGDYLNAADQAVECKEVLLEQQYADAEALEASGDWESAFAIFNALSSYRDAADRAQTLANWLGIEIKPGDSRY